MQSLSCAAGVGTQRLSTRRRKFQPQTYKHMRNVSTKNFKIIYLLLLCYSTLCTSCSGAHRNYNVSMPPGSQCQAHKVILTGFDHGKCTNNHDAIYLSLDGGKPRICKPMLLLGNETFSCQCICGSLQISVGNAELINGSRLEVLANNAISILSLQFESTNIPSLKKYANCTTKYNVSERKIVYTYDERCKSNGDFGNNSEELSSIRECYSGIGSNYHIPITPLSSTMTLVGFGHGKCHNEDILISLNGGKERPCNDQHITPVHGKVSFLCKCSSGFIEIIVGNVAELVSIKVDVIYNSKISVLSFQQGLYNNCEWSNEYDSCGTIYHVCENRLIYHCYRPCQSMDQEKSNAAAFASGVSAVTLIVFIVANI